MTVRRRFGQHFLHDPGVIRRIIDAVAPAAGEQIVEVGPGRGALTWPLLERAGRLDVVEIDRDLALALSADPRAKGGLHVHVENVLDTDFLRLRGEGGPLRIVGNLPYNISTPLLFRLLTQRFIQGCVQAMLHHQPDSGAEQCQPPEQNHRIPHRQARANRPTAHGCSPRKQ